MSADLKTRLTGAGLCLVGFFLAWIGVVEPILKGRQAAEQVSLFGIGPFLVGPLIVFGLVLLAFGAGTDARMRNAEAKRITFFGNVVFALCVIAGMATLLVPRLLLRSMGYQP